VSDKVAKARAILNRYRGGGLTLNHEMLNAIDSALGATPSTPQAPRAEAKWGYARTVGNAIAQLQTLDPEAPFFAAFHLEGHAVAWGVTFSRERVVDERWIGERYSGGKWLPVDRDSVPYSVVVWSAPVLAAPPSATAQALQVVQADAGDAGRLQQFANAVRDGIASHVADNWPMRKLTLAEVEIGIEAIEVNAVLVLARVDAALATQQPAPQQEKKQ
jgi:hypothetical protein